MTPVLGFCGASGSGKTTLLCGVLAELTSRGLKVGALKHHGHASAPPPPASPAKDSDSLLAAGAARVALAQPGGITLWAPEEPDQPAQMAAQLMAGLDLVLVEGFKSADLDKIEVVAPGQEPWLPQGGRLLALTRRGGGGTEAGLPLLDADQPRQVADFVLQWLGQEPRAHLRVNGKPVAMKPFVQDLLGNTLRALVAGLKGGENPVRIEVRLD